MLLTLGNLVPCVISKPAPVQSQQRRLCPAVVLFQRPQVRKFWHKTRSEKSALVFIARQAKRSFPPVGTHERHWQEKGRGHGLRRRAIEAKFESLNDAIGGL